MPEEDGSDDRLLETRDTVVDYFVVEPTTLGQAREMCSRQFNTEGATKYLLGIFTWIQCIDDEILRESGVTDLSPYSMTPGINESELLPDYFL